ncbi:MAG: nucleotidyltransferase domain-containing protein [Tannerella sp.]|jgi:predicted nucleotidyltransferase|nr:nucleotidyltransferase domain-containing protein [Tannerella sp.]
MNIIEQKQDSIFRLCELHKVKRLYAFGSALTGNFNDESDVDLIVDFQDIPVEEYADNYFDFKFSLQDIFNRPVDLLENQAIKNPYFLHSINKHKEIIYKQKLTH